MSNLDWQKWKEEMAKGLSKLKSIIIWLLWDFSTLRLIYSKIRPEIKTEENKREPSSFLIWIFGIYFTAFGIASSRYENRKDVLETRLAIVSTQLHTSARMGAFIRLVDIQQEKIPKRPNIQNPISVIKSLIFFDDDIDDDILKECKEIIVAEKYNLKGAILLGANLEGANLEGANLEGAILKGARLEGAILLGANLEEANLKGANLERADLKLANLKGARLEEAILWGTILWKANLERANLEGANLEGARLEEANLEGANLEGANLREANLERANLERANLREANLEGVKKLTNEQIKLSCYWEEAVFFSKDGNEKTQRWIIEEGKQNAKIEELKIDITSNPKEEIECD